MKETWSQFAERVKPYNMQSFRDTFGWVWHYRRENGVVYFQEWPSGHRMSRPSMDYPCSLVDAIDQPAKPNMRRITYYCYLNLASFYWCNRIDLDAPEALDESGNRLTKEIWVEDND